MHTLQHRVQKNVLTDPDTGCWYWQGGKDRDGYGTMWVGPHSTRKKRYVHRISYEAFVGLIPAGLEIDHLCRVKICCNPDHLEVVTTQENTRRRDAANQYDKYCRRGHERNDANVYISPNGRRSCRPCKAERARQRRAAARK